MKKTIKPEDYNAWIDNTGEGAVGKSSIYVGIKEIEDIAKFPECPPTAKIIFGRPLYFLLRTTFRAAANGDRMIAMEGFGESQYRNPGDTKDDSSGGIKWGVIIIVIVIIAGLGALGYFLFTKYKQGKGSEQEEDDTYVQSA